MSENTSGVKLTPFNDFHMALGAKMVPFAGYMMPIQYAGITEEHLAVRKNVGLFDLSHMGEFFVSGPGALEFLQKMTTNDVSALKAGQIQYSCMCYENGGIVDDLLVYRLPDEYMLIVNAANLQKDFDWLNSHKPTRVQMVNKSDDYGLLAIQGPNAQAVIEEMSDYDFNGLPYYHVTTAKIGKYDILLSRTGYTGEDGFEMYILNGQCADLWAQTMAAGKKHDMKMIGLGARDSLRLEMKMTLYGNDIDQTTTPIEAGLAWIVKAEKGDFIGRDVLVKQKEEKPSRRLVCLEIEGRAFPRHGYELLHEGTVVGHVTSGTVSPSLGKPIAMGYLKRELTNLDCRVDLKIRDKLFGAVVVKPPFYKEGSHR